MKSFYIDTNIVIDFISLRVPFGIAAKSIFELAETKNIKLYVSTLSIATSHYVLKKIYSEEEVRTAISSILDLVEVIPLTEDVLRKSLNSSHKDFEDALQIFCAHKIENLSAIITRDLKDFSTAEVQVLAPDEALYYIQNKLEN
ncbi:type II toxin-antitoxin system VapC family toxin [Frigoriflavimonas asaccharolytica]|uniref:Putative nucleic acid-binding protein n=1 Tax=Frigoriflavimonas asaccharolytica TaxID=2735899 RepID=A0A8J8K8N7_9FLAO|nr:PIN domain-containing protein [Frigoriflavimonas asaccharolytica]NRS92821.1 putative nucleic acid-binding protein [Frigoriflavimonas asaccharolytica]